MSFKNGVLEGSKLDFEGSGPRFWRVWGQFFREFHMFLAMYADNLPRIEFPPPHCRDLSKFRQAMECPPLIATLLCPFTVGPKSSKGGGAAVVPPRGFQLNNKCMIGR